MHFHDDGYDDNVPPVIIINGSNPATVELGATYTDAGATAMTNFMAQLLLPLQEQLIPTQLDHIQLLTQPLIKMVTLQQPQELLMLLIQQHR